MELLKKTPIKDVDLSTLDENAMYFVIEDDGTSDAWIGEHIEVHSHLFTHIYLPVEQVSEKKIETVYLMNIDNEATVVFAKNLSEAMDKAETISKISYHMVYSKSLPLLS